MGYYVSLGRVVLSTNQITHNNHCSELDFKIGGETVKVHFNIQFAYALIPEPLVGVVDELIRPLLGTGRLIQKKGYGRS